MSFSVSGKTAIVTGAANGIGLAVARHFAAQGANVMCADIDEDQLKAELGDAAQDEASTLRYFAGDLRKKLTVNNLLAATIDAFDGVDVLVNASRQVMPCDPTSATEDKVQVLLEQNLMTSLRMTQQVSKWMIAHPDTSEGSGPKQRSIINFSSIAARATRPSLMAFSISSAAVDQMTRSMAVALAPHNIRVNAVAFGSVMSASLQGILDEHPEFRDEIVDKTPLNRIGSASELADTVQYLASEGSSFVTGQILTVDGGRTLVDPVVAPAH
jgi:7-alpha-hydroxysteroid dehydrogenase